MWQCKYLIYDAGLVIWEANEDAFDGGVSNDWRQKEIYVAAGGDHLWVWEEWAVV